jgi:hypothetical protein
MRNLLYSELHGLILALKMVAASDSKLGFRITSLFDCRSNLAPAFISL